MQRKPALTNIIYGGRSGGIIEKKNITTIVIGNMEKPYLGIDIGGSKIKGVLFDSRKNQWFPVFNVKTPKNKKSFLIVLDREIDKIIQKKKIAGIGIGLPGIVDLKRGILIKAPNLPFLNNWQAGKFFSKFKVKTKFDNDSRCFIIGEFMLGAGRNYKNIVGIGVGTGIGGGIVINNKIYYGKNYNAGEFGDLDLRNSDVNNAFYASLGIRMPLPFSDVYDAMDAYPLDQPGVAGGDGLIRYLDWQVILARALRLDGQNWQRSWGPGGKRAVLPANLQRSANQPAVTSVPASGLAWFCEALVGVAPVANVLTGGGTVDVPIYLQIKPGYKIAGLQFRVQITPDEISPALTNAIQFIPAPGVLTPPRVYPYALNDLSCAWDMGMFNPPLQGSNGLGFIRCKLPFLAGTGHAYRVHFAMADGSPDMNTQYAFETRSAMVWVGTPARAPQSQTSDEWKQRFFGSLTDPRADDLADPNQDGQANWVEYQAGSNPAAPRLRLHVLAEQWATNTAAFKLRWFAEAGAVYRVEYSSALPGGTWFLLVSNRVGAGLIEEVLAPRYTNSARFYRVRRE